MNYNLVKKALAYLLAAALLTVSISLAVVLSADMDTRKYWVAQTVSRALHRDFSIAGDFQMRLGSTIELSAEQVSLRNPDWSSQSKMFSADKLELQLDIFSIIGSKLDYQVRLESSELALETDAAGSGNWEFNATNDQHDVRGAEISWRRWLPTSIHGTDMRMHYVDGQTGQRDIAVLKNLAVGHIDGQLHLDADGQFNEQSVKLDTDLLAKSDTDYAVDIKGQLGKLELSATGQVTDGSVARDPVVDINWVIDSPSLKMFDAKAFESVPDIGPLRASGRLHKLSGHYAISDLKAGVSDSKLKTQASGEIRDLFAGAEIALQWQLETDHFPALLEKLGVKIKHPIPGHFTIDLQLAGDLAAPRADNLKAELSGQGVKLGINGNIPNINDLYSDGDLHLALVLQADQLSDLGKLFGQELTAVGPVKMSAGIAQRKNRIALTDIKATAGDSDMQGDLTLVPADPAAGALPKISGNLQSRVFHMEALDNRDVQVKVEQGGVAATADTPVPEGEDRLFSTEELPFDLLRQYQVDVGIEIDRFISQGVTLDQLSTKVHLQGGVLQLQPFIANVDGKPVDLDLRLDASTQPATFTKKMRAEGIKLDQLLVTTGGIATIVTDLQGAGNSVASIMAHLNGQFGILVDDGKIAASNAAILSESVVQQLNPVTDGVDASTLECAAVFFEIKDGMATTPRGMAIKLPNVTWLGNGDINLATEQINIAVKSKARKGVGVSLKGLTDMVLIAGTLKTPRIQLDPQGVVGTTASYAAAISTGGLTLFLEGLRDRSQANEAVCKYVMTGATAAKDSGEGFLKSLPGRALPRGATVEDDEETID